MKRTLNSTVLSLVLLVVTAICITASGILYKQPLLHILPLYISLFISLLQSRVNRIAYLIGAGNSILYAIVYWHFRLYASAVYAILFSFTIQLATYFLWSKHPSGKATIFRAMKPRQRIGMVLVFIAVWAALYAILSATGSAYRFFDISYSLLGILVSILTMLAFIEYGPLMILSQFISIGLYLAMMRDNPAQITYLIYTLFSMMCQFMALKKIVALRNKQKGHLYENKQESSKPSSCIRSSEHSRIRPQQ